MKIVHVVGARPNFMKAAPVVSALAAYSRVHQIVVHTGQHYDQAMSQVFFEELDMPRPDMNLDVGSGTHAQQTSAIISRFEPVVLDRKPDLVVVYGDVNSTVAAAMVCAKLLVPVAHVEAGLRSFDRTMPEEINRLLTDQIADLLFTPSADGNENLLRERIDPKKIHLVGNVMIDTLTRLLPKTVSPSANDLPERYALVTLHRPSNVDEDDMLSRIVDALTELSKEVRVVFPVHPRTRRRINSFGLALPQSDRLRLLDPLPYLQFLHLQQRAAVVITDSGGIQEETTWLGIPCLTVRHNTERPITVTMGTNMLVGQDMDQLKEDVRQILRGNAKKGRVPPLWDGHAGQRIASVVAGSC